MKILHLSKITFLSVKLNCLLALFFMMPFSIIVKAQTNVSNRALSDSVIEERLVQLALQGPEVEKTAHETKINEYQLKAAQNTWMNLLAFNMNYNEFSLAKNTTSTAYVYPRYNFGISVPLGTILSRTAVKSAKENIEIGKKNTEIIKRNLREQVLTAYKEYAALEQLIAIQSELVNDVKTQLVQIEEKFRSGTATLDIYSIAQKNNNIETAALINLKLQRDIKKLELEKLIGVRLETVLKK
jgi:outer membrane protein TolC